MTAPAAPQRTEFSLRALAREVWAELEGADNHSFTKELERRIRAKDQAAALSQTLPEWARRFAASQRPSAANLQLLLDRATPASSTPGAQVSAPAASAALAGPTTSPSPPVPARRSAKARAIREEWHRWLRARYTTENGETAIGNCTGADLGFIAEGMERQAKRNTEKAAVLRKLEAALTAHGVTYVRELPEAALAAVPADVLTRDAA